MDARLRGAAGDLVLPPGTAVLGRGQGCELRINDPRLSRHHARFFLEDDYLAVEDAGSTNGVLVNTDRIHSRTGLKHGDAVACGPCLFTVILQETVVLAVRELLPQAETNHAKDTEAMEPLPAGASASRPVHQGISAAVARVEEKGSGLQLIPDEENPAPTSALAANRESRPSEPPPPAQPGQSSALFPIPDSESAADTPVDPACATDRAAPVWLRTLAIVLDGGQLLMLMAVSAIPVLITGYVLALGLAGTVMDGTLPRLMPNPPHPASSAELAMSLISPQGLARSGTLIRDLFEQEDQGPFLRLFAAATAALLIVVLEALIALVAATVVHGAPYWHRRLGVEIVEHATSYRLTWGRALARWAAAALFLVIFPVSLALPRGLADAVSGSRMRLARR